MSGSSLSAVSFPPAAAAPSSFGADLVARLGRARNLIEGRFFELGTQLEGAVEIVNALVASLDEMTAMLDTGVVDEMVAALRRAAARLGDLGAAHGRRAGRFEALTGAKVALDLRLEQMRRTLSYLRAFAFNIKITAGGIPGALAEFDAFSEELHAAIAEAGAQLDEFGDNLAALSEQIRIASRHERDLEGRCAETLPALAGRLHADAEAIAESHRMIARFAARMNELARSVQAKMAGVIGALQIGDNIRQRMEHVESGLARLASWAAASESDSQVAPVLYGLLAAQLADAGAELERELDVLEASLSGLAAEISETFRPPEATGAEGGRKESSLRGLEQSLAQAVSLAAELEEAERASGELGGAAEDTARDLAEKINSIRAIRSSIQHMALNAHLKCCRIGDAGKPLSVIAIELRVQVGELEAVASLTEGALVDLGQAPGFAQKGDGEAAIEVVLEQATAPIRALSAKVECEMVGLAGRASAMGEALRVATQRLNFRRDIAEVLRGASRAMARVAEERPHPAGAQSAAEELLAQMARSYTMAREREVHAAFLASLPGAEMAQAA